LVVVGAVVDADVGDGPTVVDVVATVGAVTVAGVVVVVGAVLVGFVVSRSMTAVRATLGGCGIVVFFGTSAMVMSSPLVKRMLAMPEV